MNDTLIFGSYIDYDYGFPEQALRAMIKEHASRLRAKTKRWVRKYNARLVGGIEYQKVGNLKEPSIKRVWIFQTVEVDKVRV